ncbi:hypothetical protein niasHT_023924 [Heterodera trifolii]|uniref:Hexosyltransferase n=1 Tax=Heterodera trifolii TaxID=157864 RepID=A0ABD2JVC9_9BILA
MVTCIWLFSFAFLLYLTNKSMGINEQAFEINFKNIRMDCWMEIGSVCPAGIKLIMLSMSRRDHFEMRTGVRQTWMKDAAPGEILRFFVADQAGGEAADVKHKLEEEQKKHGDIVFLHGFVDLYAHLHLKWFGALTWQQRHCAGAKWVAKIDDSSVVDLRRMDYWINNKFRQIADDHPLIFFGHMGGSRKPFRNWESKWSVGLKVSDIYPPFVLGPTYLTTSATVSAVMKQANKAIGFNLDDVLFTGILAELANATLSDQQTHFIWTERKFECVEGVPNVFAIWDAKSRSEMEQHHAYLKKMSCQK